MDFSVSLLTELLTRTRASQRIPLSSLGTPHFASCASLHCTYTARCFSMVCSVRTPPTCLSSALFVHCWRVSPSSAAVYVHRQRTSDLQCTYTAGVHVLSFTLYVHRQRVSSVVYVHRQHVPSTCLRSASYVHRQRVSPSSALYVHRAGVSASSAVYIHRDSDGGIGIIVLFFAKSPLCCCLKTVFLEMQHRLFLNFDSLLFKCMHLWGESFLSSSCCPYLLSKRKGEGNSDSR